MHVPCLLSRFMISGLLLSTGWFHDTATGCLLLPPGVYYCHRLSTTATGCLLPPPGFYYCHRVSTTATECLLPPPGFYYSHRVSTTATGFLLLPPRVYYCHRGSTTATGCLLLPPGVNTISINKYIIINTVTLPSWSVSTNFDTWSYRCLLNNFPPVSLYV
jgi:hypothetical protein